FSLFWCAPSSTRVPYTTLFRSLIDTLDDANGDDGVEIFRVPVGFGRGRHARIGGAGALVAAHRTARIEKILHDGREMGIRASLRSEEHTSELQSRENLVCRLLH